MVVNGLKEILLVTDSTDKKNNYLNLKKKYAEFSQHCVKDNTMNICGDLVIKIWKLTYENFCFIILLLGLEIYMWMYKSLWDRGGRTLYSHWQKFLKNT